MARVKHWMRWIFLRPLCFGGLLGALITFWASVFPSLLPRGWLFQGIVSGVTVAIGYGIGSAVSAIARRFHPPEPKADVKRWFWWGLLGLTIIAVPVSLWWGDRWNQNIREVMGMEDPEPWAWGGVVLLTVVVVAILLVISRVIRLAARGIQHLAGRWLGPRVSMAVGGVLTALLVIFLINGVLLNAAFEAVNSAYSLTDRGTTPGITQPQSELRSGSEASLVAWDSLGVQGRNFTGDGRGAEKRRGPTADQITEFSGQPAEEPIRVYVGLRSADTLAKRVDLAMQELERTGAFDREVLAVYGTTGTGWIDERVADSLEFIWDGDTAAVGLQYSYLPSWVSVLVDADKAADASIAIIGAVQARLDELPEDERPRLVLFGESLGSFATESAFEDLDDLVAGTDGAMLVGPTFGNDLRNHVTGDRDEGSPEWRPEYEAGRRVRFAVDPADFDDLTGPWETPHIAYLQNSSDPISHFSFDLLWSRPGWLDDPRAPDANPDMRWFPVVTFWQTVADLAYSFGAPVGHGHRYGANVVDGWLAVDTPDGWTDDDTQRLRDIVGHE